jgi:hypothetical protein
MARYKSDLKLILCEKIIQSMREASLTLFIAHDDQNTRMQLWSAVHLRLLPVDTSPTVEVLENLRQKMLPVYYLAVLGGPTGLLNAKLQWFDSKM